jgi:hypothetical protein
MNYCLRIDEILRNIFEHVFEGGRAGRSSVANLAITCQDFKAPALELLWSSQCSLLPLMKCLPTDVWSLRRLENRGLTRTILVRVNSNSFPQHLLSPCCSILRRSYVNPLQMSGKGLHCTHLSSRCLVSTVSDVVNIHWNYSSLKSFTSCPRSKKISFPICAD